MGLSSLSTILFAFTGASVARAFFITAGAFAALSLFGYTTKRDLTALGGFLIVGVVGLILASIVNIFLGSSGLEFLISVVGVLLFAGLTAYDTQKIKSIYYAGDSREVAGCKSIHGALTLYLDFINMFLFMVQLLATANRAGNGTPFLLIISGPRHHHGGSGLFCPAIWPRLSWFTLLFGSAL